MHKQPPKSHNSSASSSLSILSLTVTTSPPWITSSFLVFPVKISKKEASKGHRSSLLPPLNHPPASNHPPPIATFKHPLPPPKNFIPKLSLLLISIPKSFSIIVASKYWKLDLSRKSRPLGNASRHSELLFNHSIRKSVKFRAHSDDGKHGSQSHSPACSAASAGGVTEGQGYEEQGSASGAGAVAA
ncbi:unnamed protein product [Lactuca saligna]|uniref:Uncharacterized protein n=1 Tax=Lactuca saligna TaxID=75948 RepID=A0AA35ULJ9_LACSI|nr:unnamed protein product [Lactuca saligna]